MGMSWIPQIPQPGVNTPALGPARAAPNLTPWLWGTVMVLLLIAFAGLAGQRPSSYAPAFAMPGGRRVRRIRTAPSQAATADDGTE